MTIHKSVGLMKTGILKRHDKALVRAGYACFGLDRGCLARFDFSIFQCNKNLLVSTKNHINDSPSSLRFFL